MIRSIALASATCSLVLASAACSSSGAGGRRVDITQRDDGCTPASVAASPGEKLNLVIKNDSSHDPYEVEGIEGAKFEELAVPEGKSRSAGYTAPSDGSTTKLKCYVPGGATTIIEVSAGNASTVPASSATGAPEVTPAISSQTSANPPDTTVAATLLDYSITPDKASVAPGTIRFIATNTSAKNVHELAVLKVKADGSFDNAGEVQVAPGEGGTLTLDLQPGSYQLACLIAKGEAGSDVDHYQQGMHTAFEVTSGGAATP